MPLKALLINRMSWIRFLAKGVPTMGRCEWRENTIYLFPHLAAQLQYGCDVGGEERERLFEWPPILGHQPPQQLQQRPRLAHLHGNR